VLSKWIEALGKDEGRLNRSPAVGCSKHLFPNGVKTGAWVFCFDSSMESTFVNTHAYLPWISQFG
jgi:hypothetical protein